MIYFLEFIALIMLLSALYLASRYSRRRRLTNICENAKREYLRFLSSLILGAGTGETSREYNKIKQVWDFADSPKDMLAALQLSDGIAILALEDASERLDTNCIVEVERSFRHRRNHLLWAILRLAGRNKLVAKESIGDELGQELITSSKRQLEKRFYHLVKSYPRPWEHN